MALRVRARSAGKTSLLHRLFEIGLGFIMAASALLFVGVAALGMSEVTSGRERTWWAIGFALPFLFGLAYLTALLAWRLLTGRERRGGGLFPPWVLDVAGAIATWSARGPGWSSGFRSASEENAGEEIFDLARTRRQMAENKQRRDEN